MKSLLKSKTFWLAILQAIAGIATAIASVSPDIKGIGVVLIIKSAIDVILRMMTTEKIA